MGRVHIRMHREVREILAGEKSIVSVNSQYFSSEDWMNLLLGSEKIRFEACQSPSILEHLLPEHCYRVLSAHPEMIPLCSQDVWKKLSGKHLLALFCPEYDPARTEDDTEAVKKYSREAAAKCDETGVWTKFRHEEIVKLLKVDEYAGYADRLILSRLDGREWQKLLMKHPEFLQFFKKDASDQRYNHKTFQYRKFIEAVLAAEAVEKETGKEIVRKYVDWTPFDFNDWKKLRYLNRPLMERYYGKLFPDDYLPKAMDQLAQSPEDWQNRYAWEFWKCQDLQEAELESVCACLKANPGLRDITPLYETMLSKFRSARRSWMLEFFPDTVALYHRLVEQYSENCPELTAIITGDGLPKLKKNYRKTENQ